MGRDPLMIWGARSDTIYGLVTMMGRASDAVGKAGVPTAYSTARTTRSSRRTPR